MATVAGNKIAYAPCIIYKFQRLFNTRTQWTRRVCSSSRWKVNGSLSQHVTSYKTNQCLRCGSLRPISTLHGHQFHPCLQLNQQRSITSCGVLNKAPAIEFEPGSRPHSQPVVDLVKVVEEDMQHLFIDIRKELEVESEELQQLNHYYFDGKGKAVRPLLVALMGRAINFHVQGVDGYLTQEQRKLTMILEMLHTATLVHDDVIDGSDQRRGKASINALWDHKKIILAGDLMVAVVTRLLAQLGDHDVVSCITEIIQDLVIGELMQLSSKEDEDERFKHYLTKTFKKTASLLAFGCKSVAILGGANETLQEIAFQYGRNVGIAFQLIDDLLDFVSNSESLGKPAAADLKLGLATAPVLFACEKFPELNEMISRRFSKPGDVETAVKAVIKSEGLAQTKFLAEQHSREAIRCLEQLVPSPEQKALFILSDKMLGRNK